MCMRVCVSVRVCVRVSHVVDVAVLVSEGHNEKYDMYECYLIKCIHVCLIV